MKRKKHLEYPDISLYEMICRSAEKFSDLTAVEYYSRKITYKKLLQMIDKYADILSFYGVKKDDCVSVILPNIPQAVVVFYALNKLGAAASMIHPLSSENEINSYIDLTESKLVIALDLVWKKLNGISKKGCKVIFASAGDEMPLLMKAVYSVFKREKIPDEKGERWNDLIGKNTEKTNFPKLKGSDTAAVLYSGGTTGKPKGIVLTNMNFNALALQSIDACGCLKPRDRVLSVMPVFHGFGLGVCIHTVLTFGGTAVILPQFKAADFHKLILKYKPNVVAGVPSIYEYMLRSSGFKNKDLSFLKCIISGGDSLSESTKEKLDKVFAECRCKTEIREGYGLTECVTGTCLMPENSGKTGSVGLPYADTFYRIADPETEAEVPDGENGEILLSGPAVMKGYYKDEEETARALKAGDDGKIWLHTGDMGYKDNDGYVYFKQRIKRIIISNGYNIYPQNIENLIDSHRNVMNCAVVGIPDEIRGQRVKAFVVPQTNTDCRELKRELEELCRENIAAYAVPREYEFMTALPRTLVGKIAYTRLSKGEDHDKKGTSDTSGNITDKV